MLALAASYGVDTLDTAIAYGGSEACLGEVGNSAFRVVTKLPAVPAGVVDVSAWIDSQLAASLTRLRSERVHAVLLHRPQQLLGVQGRSIYTALRRHQSDGTIAKIGVSVYAPGDLDDLAERYSFDLVQAPFNIVDRRFATSGWLARLKDGGTEVHTRSAFLQGLLLLPESELPPHFAPWAGIFARWHGWLAEHRMSALDACLNFALDCPAIDRVVVGADSAAQLRQILAASHVMPGALPDLSSEAEELINPGQWSIG